MLRSNYLARASTAQDLSGMCILVLDDDPNMRSLIAGAVLSAGCRNVLRSGVARDALRLFASHKIDLVISDWSMEPMSGLEFLRELRRPERNLTVPVIMLTGNSEPLDIALALKLNISGWLVKPIALPVLIERISAVLSLSGESVSREKELAAEVARQAEHYRTRLIDELLEIDDALAAMQKTNTGATSPWAAAAARGPGWAQIDRILHNIKGQGGSFGYGLITSVAGIGQELTRPMNGNTQMIFHHHDEVRRCVATLVQAIRIVLQNNMRGDGGHAGARLLEKLRSHTEPVRATLVTGTGTRQ
jgi:two-component system, chemotaxis family, chemotaxis protein CheY